MSCNEQSFRRHTERARTPHGQPSDGVTTRAWRAVTRGCLAVALAMVWPVTTANASTIVYEQARALGPQDSDLAGYASYANAADSFKTFENFVLPIDALVTDVHWFGFYGNFDPPVSNVESFLIEFFGDASGAPGALLLSQTFVAGAFTEAAVAADPAGLPNQFEYGVDPLSTPFAVTGGIAYWVAIQATLVGTQAWHLRAGIADGVLFQQNGALAQLPGHHNVAFSLTTSAVPEPATLSLLALGLAGGAVQRRRSLARRASRSASSER